MWLCWPNKILVSNPDSLLGQVLKARYFPQSSFWEAQLINRPSLMWRSIWGVRKVLALGCEIREDGQADGGGWWLWIRGANGLFSIKSAYNLVREDEERSRPSSSNSRPVVSEVAKTFSRRLRAMKLPPRVKVLTWQANCCTLPMFANLARRYRGVETQCVLCESGMESLKHVLFYCHFARVVWALPNMPQEIYRIMLRMCWAGWLGWLRG
ncbi:UNVERIFIED_CONTAM: hypothetical protein Slati_2404400 [Sesamum latifolium]|uniref:Reverse transcriptase zinc-binding domain-containing protein n=1 Tax=Sesamum latifolium TaxID=2727402 RepID=A0AAW2WD23_9LAMI